MTWVAGVDGFKHRWFVVLRNLDSGVCRGRIVSTFAEILVLDEKPDIVAVDIPIGLAHVAMPGGRSCQRQARGILGPRRASVFTVVGRDALRASNRKDADDLSRAAGGIGIAAQAWGLASKLREADAAMSPEAQRVVHEVHPEVCFWAMKGNVPMAFGKKAPEEQRERRDSLIAAGFDASFVSGMASEQRVGRGDFLDACAAAWTAGRIAKGIAGRFPAGKSPDPRGLDQAIWFEHQRPRRPPRPKKKNRTRSRMMRPPMPPSPPVPNPPP